MFRRIEPNESQSALYITAIPMGVSLQIVHTRTLYSPSTEISTSLFLSRVVIL